MLSIKETLGIVGILEFLTFICLAYYSSTLQSLQSQKEILIASRDSLARALLQISAAHNETSHAAHFKINSINSATEAEPDKLPQDQINPSNNVDLYGQLDEQNDDKRDGSPPKIYDVNAVIYDIHNPAVTVDTAHGEHHHNNSTYTAQPVAGSLDPMQGQLAARRYEVVWNDWGRISHRRFASLADAEAFYATIGADVAHRLLNDGVELRRHVYAGAPWNPAWVPPPGAEDAEFARESAGGGAGEDGGWGGAAAGDSAADNDGVPAALRGGWRATEDHAQSEPGDDTRRWPAGGFDSEFADATSDAAAAKQGARAARRGQEQLRQSAAQRDAGPRPVRIASAGASRARRCAGDATCAIGCLFISSV